MAPAIIQNDFEKYSKEGKLKVAYVCADAAGPAWHEIYVPCKYLNETGEVYAQMFQGTFRADALAEFDIVVFQRQNTDIALTLVKGLKKQGVKTVYHFTDNLWDIPPNNPAKPHYGPEVLRKIEAIIRECDCVTTTTKFMKEYVSQFNPVVKRPWELVETDVFESYLPPPRRGDDDEVRIGWILTPHHEDDLYVVVNSLGQIARKYKNTKFIFFGHYNPTLAQTIPGTQTEAYAGVQIADYYRAAASLDIDIGIAPVIAHGFNKAKSRRKWFEYSALKAATICSEYDTYELGMTHMENCYKVKKNRTFKWTQGLEYLIENREECKRIGKNAGDHVHNYHNAKNYIHKWVDMYKSIAEL